jgi:hypothetical protein
MMLTPEPRASLFESIAKTVPINGTVRTQMSPLRPAAGADRYGVRRRRAEV